MVIKAFVDSPSPLAEGMGLVLTPFVGPYSTARAGLGTPALEPVLLRKGWMTLIDHTTTTTCWLAHPGWVPGVTHTLLVSARASLGEPAQPCQGHWL